MMPNTNTNGIDLRSKPNTKHNNTNSNSKTNTRGRRRTMIVATLSCFVIIQSLFLETEHPMVVDAFVSPTGTCKSVSSFRSGGSSFIHGDGQNQAQTLTQRSTRVPGLLHVLQSTSTIDDVIDDEPPVADNSSSSNNNNIGNNPIMENKKSVLSSRAIADKLSEKIGRVEDQRIIYPEYDTGEVTRVFSSLKYNRNELTGITTATHNAGSVFGAASLVAGTMVGAGILALPAATVEVGFLPSTGAMGIGWLYMTMSGLLIAELSINRLGQSGMPGQGMLDLYEDSLGPKWSRVGSAAYFGLHYCLLVAYIAQGGSNLNAFVGFDDLGLPAGVPQVAFAATTATALFLAKPAAIEAANKVFVSVLAVVFLGIIGFGTGSANCHALIDPANQHPENVVDALPIIFLSLVYHNVVPTVVNQLEGDRSKITKAIVYGTSVPTLMFLAWNAVVLSNVGGAALDIDGVAATIDPVAILQASASSGGSGAILANLVTTFSSLAVVTSLIGFVYGLLDAWTDVFNLPTEGPAFDKWKLPLFGLVFLPPLALSLTDPDIFFTALDYGGAFGVSTLFLVLPPIMVWKQRYGDDQQNLLTKPMVPLGKSPLGSMWKAAGTLILEQGADKLGVFDWFQQQFQ